MPSLQKGSMVLLAGLLVMVLAIILGEFLQQDLESTGMQVMLERKDTLQPLALIVFIFGFPLGIGVVVTGAALRGGASVQRALLFAVMAFAGVLLTLLVHGLLGTSHSPWFFGGGGILIMLLLTAAAWYWGKSRAEAEEDHRVTLDWQAMGYLCFAFASWNLCGVGSVPGMALYPEKMMMLEPRYFAVAQMKSVMLFLVLGWLFTLTAFRRQSGKAGRARR